ncbi:hypothetical protein [Nocardioides montaniterrae]
MRRTPLLAGSVVLVLSLTACGGGDAKPDGGAAAAAAYAKTPPKQIEKDAKAAFEKLTSVHLSGKFRKDGGLMSIDVDVATSGDCKGTIAMPGSGSFELRQVDGVSYFKGDDTFWKAAAGAHAAEVQAVINGRWVTDSADPNGFGALCDLDNLRKGMGDTKDKNGPGVVVGTGSIDGIATVKIRAKDDQDGALETVQVQGETPHNLVRVDRPKGEFMQLTDFNEPVEVTAPPKSDVFDKSANG